MLAGRTGLRLHPGVTAQGGKGSGAGGAAAQCTVIRVIETAAGGLDVRSGLSVLRAVLVIRQGIQARQAGASRQEDGKEEERLDSEQVAPGPAGGGHGLEYTHTRSAAVLRLTGPSAGSRNQKAEPLP
jgi:hypothetical protein